MSVDVNRLGKDFPTHAGGALPVHDRNPFRAAQILFHDNDLAWERQNGGSVDAQRRSMPNREMPLLIANGTGSLVGSSC